MADVPILTTVDAVASFMRKPDKSTKGQCLLSKRSAYKTAPGSWRYNKNPRRWGSAVSFQRWAICLLLYTISIAICVGLRRYGLSYITNASAVWKLGAVDSQALIHGDNFPTSLTTNIIRANTPQAIFSILYFSTTSAFTVMTSAA
ncbi:hypothetical protein AWENTII_009530 [Aspergillus wentii]|nr:hypothetical protein MW887_001235 [Aspergillus wentii]